MKTLVQIVNGHHAVHEMRHQQTVALRVVPDVRRSIHIVEYGLERTGGRAAINRLSIPTGYQKRSIIEEHKTVEASLRKSGHIGLLTVIDLIQLVCAEGNDPQLPAFGFQAVRSLQIVTGGDLLRFVFSDLPDRIGAGGLEVSARAGFQSAVGNVHGDPVAGEIIEERAARNLDLPFWRAALAIELPDRGD